MTSQTQLPKTPRQSGVARTIFEYVIVLIGTTIALVALLGGHS